MNDALVIDTSAFVAILFQEPEAATFSAVIRAYPVRSMAAASYLEAAMVTSGRQNGRADLDEWLARESIAVTPVDHGLAQIAADAFAHYGKGRHGAGLKLRRLLLLILWRGRSTRRCRSREATSGPPGDAGVQPV